MFLRLSGFKQRVIGGIFGDRDKLSFWEMRFLPQWLPLLLGFGLSIFLALLVTRQDWHLAILLTLVVPAFVLFIRYPFLAVVTWMTLLPFFVITPTTTERVMYWFLHRALIPLALVIETIASWVGIKNRNHVRPSAADRAILAFLGLVLVSIMFLSEEPIQAIILLYDDIVIPLCAYWLIRLTAHSKEDMKGFFGAAFIALVVQCAIGLLAWYAPHVLPVSWASELQGERMVGTFGNPVVYASTLLFLALLLFQYAMNTSRKFLRYLFLASFCLGMICVFMSFSRTVWIGALTILVGLVFVYPKTVLRLGVVLILFVVLLSSSLLADELAWGMERLTGQSAQYSGQSRVIANYALIGMIKAKPVFGWGYNNYELYNQGFLTSVWDIPITLGYGVSSHNSYLTIMSELGVFAIFLYLFPAGWWLWHSVKVRGQLVGNSFWSWNLVVILWLLLSQMFIANNFMDMIRYYPYGTTIWWIALGLIASLVSPYIKFQLKGISGFKLV